jgi:hypothetical protein
MPLPFHTIWLGARLGLANDAPQLGWKTYGFGTIDRLIDLGRRLEGTPSSGPLAPGSLGPEATAIAADLALIASSLARPGIELESLARLCARLHGLLSKAQHQPQQRRQWLAQVEALCAATP